MTVTIELWRSWEIIESIAVFYLLKLTNKWSIILWNLSWIYEIFAVIIKKLSSQIIMSSNRSFFFYRKRHHFLLSFSKATKTFSWKIFTLVWCLIVKTVFWNQEKKIKKREEWKPNVLEPNRLSKNESKPNRTQTSF